MLAVQQTNPSSAMQGFYLLVLIALLGVVGVMLVLLLSIAWRRFNRRTAPPPVPATEQDIWQESAHRLTQRMDDEQQQREKLKHLHDPPPGSDDLPPDWTPEQDPPDGPETPDDNPETDPDGDRPRA